MKKKFWAIFCATAMVFAIMPGIVGGQFAKADGEDVEPILKAYYNFDAVTAGQDRSGQGNHAEVVGELVYSTGIYGNGLNFTGEKRNHLALPNYILSERTSDSEQGINRSATIAFWFKFEQIQAGWVQVFGFGNGSDDSTLRMMINEHGEVMVEYSVPGHANRTKLVCWADSMWKPQSGSWYHTAIVVDGRHNKLALYKDGVKLKEVDPLQYPDNGQEIPGNPSVDLALNKLIDNNNVFGNAGNNYPDHYFKGVLDELRIYSGALKSGDITELYNDFASLNTPAFTAHYSFEGEDWSNDVSGNGRDLTVVGELATQAGKIGNALKFNGSKENHIKFPNGILTSPDGMSRNSATIAFWINFANIESDKWNQIFGFGNMNDDCSFRMLINPHGEIAVEYEVPGVGQRTRIHMWGDGEWKPAADIWYHTAIVLDGTNNKIKVYLDGALRKEGVITQQENNSVSIDNVPLALSKLADVNNVFGYSSNYDDPVFDGLLDEMFVFSTALDDDAISNLYTDNTSPISNGAMKTIKRLVNQYQDMTVYQGEDVTVTVSPYDFLTNIEDIQYQWKIATNAGFENIEGATTNSVTINKILATEVIDGQSEIILRLVAGDGTLETDSADIKLVVKQTSMPQVESQPQDIRAKIGESVTFEVEATGAPEVTYSWYRGDAALTDGDNVMGTNTSRLQITVKDTQDFAEYHCVVTNMAGTATSQKASLIQKLSAVITGVTEGTKYTADVVVVIENAGDGQIIVMKDGVILKSDLDNGSHTLADNGSYTIMATGEDNNQVAVSFKIEKANDGTTVPGGNTDGEDQTTPQAKSYTGLIIGLSVAGIAAIWGTAGVVYYIRRKKQ